MYVGCGQVHDNDPLPPRSVSTEEREEVLSPATQVWQPNKMPDHKVEQFLVVAR